MQWRRLFDDSEAVSTMISPVSDKQTSVPHAEGTLETGTVQPEPIVLPSRGYNYK